MQMTRLEHTYKTVPPDQLQQCSDNRDEHSATKVMQASGRAQRNAQIKWNSSQCSGRLQYIKPEQQWTQAQDWSVTKEK